jgi:hypothetical protein
MLVQLIRKFVTLSVLVVALTVASVASVRAEKTCWSCTCIDGHCSCVQVLCPDGAAAS